MLFAVEFADCPTRRFALVKTDDGLTLESHIRTQDVWTKQACPFNLLEYLFKPKADARGSIQLFPLPNPIRLKRIKDRWTVWTATRHHITDSQIDKITVHAGLSGPHITIHTLHPSEHEPVRNQTTIGNLPSQWLQQCLKVKALLAN